MKNLLISSFFVVILCGVLTQSCEQKPYKHGEILYQNFCQNCHNEDGEALRKLIPPLANSDYLINHKEELACIIRYGLEGEIVVNGIKYNQVMSPIDKLTDVEIANIINYINNTWGNSNGYTSLVDVQKSLENCDSE